MTPEALLARIDKTFCLNFLSRMVQQKNAALQSIGLENLTRLGIAAARTCRGM